ncbi:hypothetical protein [Acidilobus saccharovorans]|uniref:hypothetical protein n=1 Tax=Acidilobus saccharovorans TaxID=242703 RepID=UPI000662AE0B|nr:hypothetical protein [Acidilobus saccharovorans]
MVNPSAIKREPLIQRVRAKVLSEYDNMRMQLVNEGGLLVTTALDDSDVEKLVLLALEEAKSPVSWRELKAIFQGIVGEDRLRRILGSLKARNVVAELTHTRYSLPNYVPELEMNKVKNPLVFRNANEDQENLYEDNSN